MAFFILRLRWTVRYLVLLLLGLGIPSLTGYLISLEDKPVTTGAPGPVYQGPDDRRRIALTFNVCWGEEYLPQIMKILRDNKVGATFFLGGEWVEKFPELAQEIGRDFEVGSHGYYHRHPDRLSVTENLADLKKAEAAIRRITKKQPRLFAPPYGECGPSILQAADAAGYRVILWSVDTVDWRRPAAAQISGKVISRAHNGAIVLLHPTAPTAEALPVIIRELSGRGFEFVSVSALLGDVTKP
ncbi:MAG: polysaccharide deacetylase family protein [Bacillota bacterium]